MSGEAATARCDHKTERRRSLDDRHNFRRIARSHDQGDARRAAPIDQVLRKFHSRIIIGKRVLTTDD